LIDLTLIGRSFAWSKLYGKVAFW